MKDTRGNSAVSGLCVACAAAGLIFVGGRWLYVSTDQAGSLLECKVSPTEACDDATRAEATAYVARSRSDPKQWALSPEEPGLERPPAWLDPVEWLASAITFGATGGLSSLGQGALSMTTYFSQRSLLPQIERWIVQSTAKRQLTGILPQQL